MSFKFFHILFITLSSVMSVVVGIWALDAYGEDGSAIWLGLAVLAIGGSAGLVFYGTRFLQKMRKLGIAMFVVAGTLAAPGDVLACAVCMGNTDSLLRSGMNMGILALLGFTGFMLVSFASFFIYLARRAAASPVPGSEFQVPGSGSGFQVPGPQSHEGSL